MTESARRSLSQSLSGRVGNPFRGWERRRLVVFWVRVALVGISTLVAIKVVQPSLVLKDTTPTGGDMGAHVW
ncbi:MAG: hypothetical protein ACO230_12380, partial [Ilumatobacteraceae bacterium]